MSAVVILRYSIVVAKFLCLRYFETFSIRIPLFNRCVALLLRIVCVPIFLSIPACLHSLLSALYTHSLEACLPWLLNIIKSDGFKSLLSQYLFICLNTCRLHGTGSMSLLARFFPPITLISRFSKLRSLTLTFKASETRRAGV